MATETLAVGMEIPVLVLPALRQDDLRRYAEASGDHAQVHLDAAHARAMGFPDVIAHGLLVMAYLGRILTEWKPVHQLRSFSCRFTSATLLGDRLQCAGTIAALRSAGAERLADLDLIVRNQSGEVKLRGCCDGGSGPGWLTKVEIKAAVATAPHAPFAIESVRLDAPRPEEVLVELVATGICHTDVAIVDQILPLPLPIVLGHEGAGVVIETGSAVTGIAKGDHVVLTFGSCGNCGRCSSGHPAYCESQPLLNFAGRRTDGSPTIHRASGDPVNASFFGQSSFATHALSPVRNVIPVPRDAPLRFLGPLGCGLMTGAGAVLNVLKPGPRLQVRHFWRGCAGIRGVVRGKAGRLPRHRGR